MLLPVFNDLLKPTQRKIFAELKRSRSLTTSELALRLGLSYMAIKIQCEELRRLGYLTKSRVPRREVGRPEIFYHLSQKAQDLFPQAGMAFSLALLSELKILKGDSYPDKLIFQYFEKLGAKWIIHLSKIDTLEEKLKKLCQLRLKDGHACEVVRHEPTHTLRMIEHHQPLRDLFQSYPRAILIEQRMLEQLLGTAIMRFEEPSSPLAVAPIIYEINDSLVP
ncbi:MAG: winged helix-turn-helix transcriptional regulator [Verrucomicrobia bacterium]|nr:MAG: winged helix-turn-helix transcriptional regulator [Verrucomicrobiota bacterium]